MAKDIEMKKGNDIITINPNSLEKFLKLGYVENSSKVENKQVEIKPKEDKKEIYKPKITKE
tara:strand:+ start:183 stop:365 length:183 start_codon:yes stop_codon:yes gene_type:complete